MLSTSSLFCFYLRVGLIKLLRLASASNFAAQQELELMILLIQSPRYLGLHLDQHTYLLRPNGMRAFGK